MAYLNTHDRTSGPTNNDKFQTTGRMPALFGVFMGYVKGVDDVQLNGRLRVWIPEFGSAPENEDGWIIVNYCSPFAGATNVQTASQSDTKSFEGTQTSYGMWMVPPDINNIVLIMFINGDSSRGIWIGSLYNQFMNNMVPGMSGSENNYQYPGKFIPVAEYNKWDKSNTNPDSATKPYEATKFKGLGNQGLLTDFHRGVSDSSARRESPSAVFGIVTPGPVIDSTVPRASYRRKGGSSFIMDDAIGSESVVLSTKSGAQIKIDETNGFIYLVNRDGTAWIQMDQKGDVEIFGAANISLRSQKDVNIRADRNVNIEAGQNIYMKAAKDTKASTTSFTYDVNNVPKPSTIPYYQYVGEGAGEGGNIVMQSLNNWHNTVKNNAYLTIGKNFELQVNDTIDINATNAYNLTSPTIKNVGAVKIRGTLDVTEDATFDKNVSVVLDVHGRNGSFTTMVSGATGSFAGPVNAGSVSSSGTMNANNVSIFGAMNAASVSVLTSVTAGTVTAAGAITGNTGTPGTRGTIGAAGVAGTTISPFSIPVAPDPIKAEVKPLIEKINILATWSDPSSKFKRNSESINTTVSTFPTYEPCPEHETFSLRAITGYTPKVTEGAKTYQGSSGAGNEATASPATNTDPGANNSDIPPADTSDNATVKDFNLAAYQCQLKIHEGVKYISYLDSRGFPTGGIGHLLRTNEIPLYPVGTPIDAAQVDSWFQMDAAISIAGAQRLIGTDVWGELSDIRKRACADLCYNLGEAKLSKFKRFIAAMKISDYNAAGVSLRDSLWFTQVGRRGPDIIAMIVQNIDPNGCDKKFPPSV